MYFDFGVVHRSCMLQGFYDAEIAIVELGIFSGQCDMQRLFGMAYLVDERLSVLQVRFSLLVKKSLLYQEMDVLLFERQRNAINAFLVDGLYDKVFFYIGKERDFLLESLIDRL